MAELNATLSSTSFSLSSSWRYTYSSTSNGIHTYTKSYGPSTAAYTITANLDSLPSNAKITSAKLTWTASATSGTGGIDTGTGRGKVVPNGQSDASILTSALTADFTDYIIPGSENSFQFTYAPYVSSSYTTGVQATQINGSSALTIRNIALTIEYQSGSIIYHAENGVLVPYQLFHAENGKLVPYQIQHGEGGKLVPY